MKRGKYDAIINEWSRGGTDNQENRRKEIAGNMIVNVKGARVAIGKDMANKIMV